MPRLARNSRALSACVRTLVRSADPNPLGISSSFSPYSLQLQQPPQSKMWRCAGKNVLRAAGVGQKWVNRRTLFPRRINGGRQLACHSTSAADDVVPPANPPVVICGGGIGGMTLGVALHIAGVPAVILEQSDEITAEVGNGIGLWGPALMVLRALGLEHQVQSQGRYMQCAGYKDISQGPGQWLVLPSDMAAERASASLRLRSCLCIRRGALQMALKDALPSGMLRLSARVSHVGPEGVHLASGETVPARVVVAADGVWSSMRRAVLPASSATAEPFDSGYDYWRAITTMPFNDLSSDHMKAFEAWGADRRFAMVPLSGNELFWFAAVDRRNESTPPSPDDRKASREWLLREFGNEAGAHPFVASIIESTPPEAIDKTPIMDMPRLPHYVITGVDQGDTTGVIPPVVLLGDAAHAMVGACGCYVFPPRELAVAHKCCYASTGAQPSSRRMFGHGRGYKARERTSPGAGSKDCSPGPCTEGIRA